MTIVDSHSAEVAELPVIALAPREHFAVDGECHGVTPTGVHRHLLDDVLAERRDLLRDGHVSAANAESEAAARRLTARVQLPVLRHCEEHHRVSGPCRTRVQFSALYADQDSGDNKCSSLVQTASCAKSVCATLTTEETFRSTDNLNTF